MKLADYFESLVKLTKLDQDSANWILVEILAYTKNEGITINQLPIELTNIADLIILYNKGKLSNTNAKKIFKIMLSDSRTPIDIMEQEQLMMIEDDSLIEELTENVFLDNSNEFDRLKNGEMKLIGFFVGQIMKKSKGKADPKMIQKIINKKIEII